MKINDSNFDDFLKSTDKLTIIDFGAKRCGPCRIMGLHLYMAQNQYKDEIIVGYVDVDDDDTHQLVTKYAIRGIPTILYFKNGECVSKQVGESKEKLYNVMNKFINGGDSYIKRSQRETEKDYIKKDCINYIPEI
jgi:thioredoxin 1